MSMHPDGARWNTPIYIYAIVPARPAAGEAFGSTSTTNSLGTIATGPFAAVVGDGPQTGSLGRSREELAPQLLAHQKAIEQIMRATPLLPVKFGTFAPDETSVRVILERGKTAFEAAFSRLDGCVQMEILVKWDLKTVFAEVAEEDVVARLKRKLELAAGAPNEASRAELGRVVKDALERRRAALATTLLEALRAVAVDAITYPATADQVVLHLVLLMKFDDTTRLDHCLESLDAAYGGQLAFRCVGPFAPYSFATVEVEVVDAAALAHARRLLGIGSDASIGQVRAAYRRLAKSIHPDLAGSIAGDSAGMVALTDAYRILSLNAEADDGRHRIEGGDSTASRYSVDHLVNVFVRRQPEASDDAA